MFVDNKNFFDDAAEHLTTEASDSYIDLKSVIPDLGSGKPIYGEYVVTTAMTDSSSNSTMTLTLETASESTFSSPTTALTIGTFAAVSAAGTKIKFVIPPGSVMQRYLRTKYTVANGDLTTGKFSGYLLIDSQNWVAMPDNVTRN